MNKMRKNIHLPWFEEVKKYSHANEGDEQQFEDYLVDAWIALAGAAQLVNFLIYHSQGKEEWEHTHSILIESNKFLMSAGYDLIRISPIKDSRMQEMSSTAFDELIESFKSPKSGPAVISPEGTIRVNLVLEEAKEQAIEALDSSENLEEFAKDPSDIRNIIRKISEGIEHLEAAEGTI